VINLAEKIVVKEIKVSLAKELIGRKYWVMYLVVNDIHNQLLARTKFAATASAQFNVFISEHVNAYLTGGKMPPTEIEGPILNIADDLLSEREPTLKTGDYITLQNYMQKTNPKSLMKA
jgi:hypothetical protein